MASLLHVRAFTLPPAAAWVAAGALAACLATGWRWQEAQRVASAARAGTALEEQLHGARSAPAPASHADFAQRLPRAATVEPVVNQLQRSGAAVGVAFVSFSASARPASEQALGRTDLAVNLRGTYTNLKAVLAEVLERSPGLTLQHLSLRRASAGGELEARADFLLVTRPLIAESAASGVVR